MNIIDWLLLDPFHYDSIFTLIVMFGEEAVYEAINTGIVVVDDVAVRINIQ
jgi:hypothetical protein